MFKTLSCFLFFIMIVQLDLETRLPNSSHSSMTVSDVDEKWLVVENVHSYGRDVTYPHIFVRKEVLQNGGKAQLLSRYHAIQKCEQEGTFLPPMSLLCPLVVALYTSREKPFVAPVLAQFKEDV